MALVRASKQGIVAKLPEIGRLFKGAPKTDPKRPGADLDHFRFEPDERFKFYGSTDGKHESLYHELLARYEAIENKRAIAIRFPFSRLEENFSSTNEIWARVGANEKCIRRCNGDVCSVRLVEMQDAAGKTVKRPMKGHFACEAGENDINCPAGCKPVGRLKIVIPELGYPGLVILTTHSIYDIEEMRANLVFYQEYDLRGFPFRLCRQLRPCPWTKPDGTVLDQKKWLCHLEIDPAYGLMTLEARERQTRSVLLGESQSERLMLPSAGGFDFGDDEIEVPVQTTVADYRDLDIWYQIECKFQNCKTHRELEQIEAIAVGYIQTGELPQNATHAVERLAEITRQKLRDRPTAPAPVPPQTVQTIDAIATVSTPKPSAAKLISAAKKEANVTSEVAQMLARQVKNITDESVIVKPSDLSNTEVATLCNLIQGYHFEQANQSHQSEILTENPDKITDETVILTGASRGLDDDW